MDDFIAPQPSSCPVCGLSRASSEHIISCQADRIQELAQELAELKQRLSIYENSNSPPSRNSLLYREMKSKRKAERTSGIGGEDVSAPRKRGRRDGHDGVKQVFTPTTGRAVVHRMDRCPACDSPRLVVKATKRRTVVDIPEPLPYTVREHVVNVYSNPVTSTSSLHQPNSLKTFSIGKSMNGMASLGWYPPARSKKGKSFLRSGL